jgi:hypothetical protein
MARRQRREAGMHKDSFVGNESQFILGKVALIH